MRNSLGARGDPGPHGVCLVETCLIPVEDIVDRFGPRWSHGGGFLVAIAWVINSSASSLPVLYVAAAIGGIGTGCVYGSVLETR